MSGQVTESLPVLYQEVYQGQTQGGGDFDEKEGA